MILPVFLYGQAVLRQKAEDVAKDYPEIKKLVADMYDTMYHADGVGLAAPQIGLSIRLLVIDANVLGDDFPRTCHKLGHLLRGKGQQYGHKFFNVF